MVWLYGVYRHFQQYFSYIVLPSFIGGWNMSNRRKQSTCPKLLTNFITFCCIEYTSPWKGFELTILALICTGCTDRCKSNYHTITTMTAPIDIRKWWLTYYGINVLCFITLMMCVWYTNTMGAFFYSNHDHDLLLIMNIIEKFVKTLYHDHDQLCQYQYQ